MWCRISSGQGGQGLQQRCACSVSRVRHSGSCVWWWQAFRSRYSVLPGVNQDAARFFSSAASPPPAFAAPAAFDLSALHHSLPTSHSQTPIHAQSPIQSPSLQAGPAAWAADFLLQQPGTSASVSLTGGAQRQATPMAVEQNMSTVQQHVPNTYMPGRSNSSSPMIVR